MTDISKEAVEWPREIWMKERDDHDQGLFYGVLSVFATVDREEEFNRYIDANIYDSAEKYHAARYEDQAARIAELEGERDRQYEQNCEQIIYIAELETALANPKVQALVEALELAKKRLIWAAGIIHNDTARDIAGTHVNEVESALAALGKEPT